MSVAGNTDDIDFSEFLTDFEFDEAATDNGGLENFDFNLPGQATEQVEDLSSEVSAILLHNNTDFPLSPSPFPFTTSTLTSPQPLTDPFLQQPRPAELNTAGEMMDFAWETDAYGHRSSEPMSTEQATTPIQLPTPQPTLPATAQSQAPVTQQVASQQSTPAPAQAQAQVPNEQHLHVRQPAPNPRDVSDTDQVHPRQPGSNLPQSGTAQRCQAQQSTQKPTQHPAAQARAATTQQPTAPQSPLAHGTQRSRALQTTQPNGTQQRRARVPARRRDNQQTTLLQQATNGARLHRERQEVAQPQQKQPRPQQAQQQQPPASPSQLIQNAWEAEDAGLAELERWCREQDTLGSQESQRPQTQKPAAQSTESTNAPTPTPQTSGNQQQAQTQPRATTVNHQEGQQQQQQQTFAVPQHGPPPPFVNSPQTHPQQLPLPTAPEPPAAAAAAAKKSLAEMVARPRHLQLTVPKPAPGETAKRTFARRPRVPYIRITGDMTEEQKLEAARKNQEMSELDRAEKRVANNAAAKRSRDARKALVASQAAEIRRLTVRGRAQDEGFTRMARRQQEMSKHMEAINVQLVKARRELEELRRRHRGPGCGQGPGGPPGGNGRGPGGGPQGGNGGTGLGNSLGGGGFGRVGFGPGSGGAGGTGIGV